MILLNATGVAKSFGDEEILQDIDLSLQSGDRLGLIGANGSGKSTLLKLFAGTWEPDAGQIDRPRDVSLGYLPQAARVSGRLPLYEEMERLFDHADPLEPYDFKIRRALHGVGLAEDCWPRPTESLSGGEKCRAALARVLLSQPDVLLLDEPTNHLDVAGREWLEAYLSRFAGAVVIVAHDRTLLNRSTNRTGFLLARRLKLYGGNFEASRAQWDEERERAEKEYARQREFISKTEDFIRRNIAGQKTKQAKSRRKMLSRLDRVERPETETGGPKVGWRHAGRSRAEVVHLEQCELGYDKPLLMIERLILRRGERVGIVGPNGTGKSTLLRTLIGELPPLSGHAAVAERTRASFFRQEIEPFEDDLTVEEHFWNVVPGWLRGQVRSYLARFLFRRDEVEKSVKALSGGERRRLELARLTIEPAHVLILDEPTNHLDLLAQDAVAGAMADFGGALLVVSHDRWLLDQVCEKLWIFADGTVREYLGTYSEYAARQAETAAVEPSSALKNKPVSDRRQRQRERQKLERQVAQLEERIAALESEIAALDAEGRDPATASKWERLNFLNTEKRKKGRELERVMAEWEQASRELEEISAEEG